MGKPIVGQFLAHPKISEAASHIQKIATAQLVDLYEQGKEKSGFPPLFGDEVEYALLGFDDDHRNVKLAPKQRSVLKKLEKATERNETEQKPNGHQAGYTAEFAKYMVESEPPEPYNSSMKSILTVEKSMARRRADIKRQLSQNEDVFTLSIFPRLAAGKDTVSAQTESSKSNLISEQARFKAANENINARRERPIHVTVPLFQDVKTLSDQKSLPDNINPTKKQINLEGLIFGPGHCGFQVTFQAADEAEARYLHDQLIPLGPVMLALTASTPIYRGYLADTDVRWNALANAIDDRPLRELHTNGQKKAPPRRWSANETYISTSLRLHPSYQRTDLPINEKVKRTLEANGMDPILSHHYAHILIRDPLIISESDAQAATSTVSTNSTDDNANLISSYAHFESLEGTTWPHVRFKLPPAGQVDIGWRVEFRAMETQLTDFENAAFAVFICLVRLAITHFDLNLYVPIGLVQENMERAHPRDAIRQGKFWFRPSVKGEEEVEARLMSVNAIINGSDEFLGLLPLVEQYVRETGFDTEKPGVLEPYLQLVRGRASGRLMTAARWMREFVRDHEDYKQDSYVSEGVCYDLMKAVQRIANGERKGGMFEMA